MEAPTTSAASAITMIATKRAVMIDNLARAISDLADTSPKDLAHPSLGPPLSPNKKRGPSSCQRIGRPTNLSRSPAPLVG